MLFVEGLLLERNLEKACKNKKSSLISLLHTVGTIWIQEPILPALPV